MGDWIYESPDNGKTVTRRLPNDFDVVNGKEMQMPDGRWYTLNQLKEIGKQHAHERKMRDLYPQLMELWESYQTMLKLIDEGPTDERL